MYEDENIVVVDKYTVRFDLNKVHGPFIDHLTHDTMSITSAEYGAQLLKEGKNLERYDNKPVGTGVFKFSKYRRDEAVRFKAHKSYFKNPAKVSNVEKLTRSSDLPTSILDR